MRQPTAAGPVGLIVIETDWPLACGRLADFACEFVESTPVAADCCQLQAELEQAARQLRRKIALAERLGR